MEEQPCSAVRLQNRAKERPRFRSAGVRQEGGAWRPGREPCCGLGARLQGVKRCVGGEEAEAQGVDCSSRNLAGEAGRDGSGARGGSRVRKAKVFPHRGGTRERKAGGGPRAQGIGASGMRVLTDTQRRLQLTDAGLQEEELRQPREGWETVWDRDQGQGLARPWGRRRGPGEGCGRCVPGRRGARPGLGQGPGGGSHADKHRDKLISSVYPGAGASSPATSSFSFPGSRVGAGM